MKLPASSGIPGKNHDEIHNETLAPPQLFHYETVYLYLFPPFISSKIFNYRVPTFVCCPYNRKYQERKYGEDACN